MLPHPISNVLVHDVNPTSSSCTKPLPVEREMPKEDKRERSRRQNDPSVFICGCTKKLSLYVVVAVIMCVCVCVCVCVKNIKMEISQVKVMLFKAKITLLFFRRLDKW